MVLETENDIILIDPMLEDQGVMPSFTLFRHPARKNPTVPLPKNSKTGIRKSNTLPNNSSTPRPY